MLIGRIVKGQMMLALIRLRSMKTKIAQRMQDGQPTSFFDFVIAPAKRKMIVPMLKHLMLSDGFPHLGQLISKGELVWGN
jgi:hypothetical protein